MSSVYTECTENPCQNQGICRILAGSYMCVCMPGYSGDFCEDGQHNKNSTDVYAILHNMYTGVPTKPPTDQLSVIIGATIGCIAVLCVLIVIIIIVIVVVWCRTKKKSKSLELAEEKKKNIYDLKTF